MKDKSFVYCVNEFDLLYCLLKLKTYKILDQKLYLIHLYLRIINSVTM